MPRRPRVWEGMSSDALHPAVPALTWVPPLSPPGLVAAWPDSPGLLPPPCLLPTPGQGATLPEGGTVLAQVRGSGVEKGQQPAVSLCLSAPSVCQHVCVSV